MIIVKADDRKNKLYVSNLIDYYHKDILNNTKTAVHHEIYKNREDLHKMIKKFKKKHSQELTKKDLENM